MRVLIALALAALAAMALGLATGTQGIEPAVAWQALAGGDGTAHDIVVGLRAPRVLAAMGCGALLALAGALLQALLRNPLADPFVLGISGGAAACSLLALLFGFAGAMTLAGLAGALASTAILFALAWRGGLLPVRLLLAGVILSSAWGALITLTLALAPDAPLRGMVFWLMGDLSHVAPASAPWPLALAAVAVALALPLARGLDALVHGELSAAALGVAVGPLRTGALVLAAAITAVVVVQVGSIGFVGLVTPHLLRLAGVHRHRVLLPASALAGGALLVLADVAARATMAPLQLPVGAITAALGAPLFLWLLARTTPRSTR